MGCSEAARSLKVGWSYMESGLSTLKILTVDDNIESRQVITRLLIGMGCQVVSAASAKDAVEILGADNEISLVLMDIQMPGTNGYEATELIRALPFPSCHIPIIALTANSLDDEGQRCLAAGMNGYLVKPVKPATLREALLEFTASSGSSKDVH